MSIKVTEKSFYPFIIDLLKSLSSNDVKVHGVSEVSIPGRTFPDIMMEIDGHRVVIQVKIGAPERLIEDIVKSYSPVRSLKADLIGILFPEEVRQIPPGELEKVYPQLTVTRGLILTPWQSQDVENITLYNLFNSIIRAYAEYKRTLTPIVDYLTVAKIARETVEELAVTFRRYTGVERYRDAVSAIVGRFDYYRAMLEDFLSEDEMRIYTADIAAYLLTLQLLFLHIISKRIYKTDALPKIDNPLEPQEDLIWRLKRATESSKVIEDYNKVLGALPSILDILQELVARDPGINYLLSRYIYVLYTLKPESVKEELFGRIYQLGLPPETRKNLGAFFTKPEASKLLASLAVERWDEKVLDPACGSGTLLAESYQAKARLAKEQAMMGLDKKLMDDLIGIDIMHFARELTSINLALQNPSAGVAPKVFVGDGLMKMVCAGGEDDPSVQMRISNYLEGLKADYEELTLPKEGIDIVIMNPPFTRRERIPEEERKKLDELLGDIVRGKVGYSLYFFVAADNVIKPGGKLAAVTPEEFFVGRSAESVRRYMFFGEVFDDLQERYVRKLDRIYRIKYVIRSGAEVAFSEGAHYRDYLAVFEKIRESKRDDVMIFVALKKRLSEIGDKELLNIVRQLKGFEQSPTNSISTECFDARKLHIGLFLNEHIDNLKPLVGLNCIKAQELVLELLDSLSRYPTLNDLEREGKLSIRLYRPGQRRMKGLEGIVQKLVIACYGERSPNLTFRLERRGKNEVKAKLKYMEKTMSIKRSDLIYSLWTSAGVKHLDVTSEEEYAIVNPSVIPHEVSYLIADEASINNACLDLSNAYNGFGSSILLSRRVRATSRNIYWMAFYTRNKTLGIQLPNIIIFDSSINPQILALYLNSTIALLQLLAFVAEVEGGWLSLDHRRVWSHIHVPDMQAIPRELEKQALNVFERVSKLDVPPLYVRIRNKDENQREIDVTALRLLGLESLANKLDEIYDSVLGELEIMQRILRDGPRKSRVKRKEEAREEQKRQEILDTFFKE